MRPFSRTFPTPPALLAPPPVPEALFPPLLDVGPSTFVPGTASGCVADGDARTVSAMWQPRASNGTHPAHNPTRRTTGSRAPVKCGVTRGG